MADRAMSESRPFLGVERSASSRVWRDRLDARASQTALALDAAPRLARALGPRARRARRHARRRRSLSRSDREEPAARPRYAHRHAGGGHAPRRRRRAQGERRDPRRLRRRRRHLGGAAGAGAARLRARPDLPYPRPAVRGLRAERRDRAHARRPRARCWSPSIAAPPASRRSKKPGSSASTWSSSTIIRRPSNCRPRAPS